RRGPHDPDGSGRASGRGGGRPACPGRSTRRDDRDPPRRPAGRPVPAGPRVSERTGIDAPLARAGIQGLSTATARRLAAKGVQNVRDLLEYAPRTYIDLSNTRAIRDLKIGEQATVLGRIHRVDGRYLRGRKHMLTLK